MNNLKRVLVLLALGLAGAAHAYQQGATADGRGYISGGISDEERVELQPQREQFSLWVVTAARKSGAYLSEVQLTIRDAQQRIVFDAALQGPWLFIDLQPGRYTLEARYNGQMQQRPTTIRPGGRRQAFFYFDDESSGDGPGAASAPSAYLGWRLYQAQCSRCHGADATGTDAAPNLLPRVKGMSDGRFVATVLQRYQWTVPQGEAGAEGAGRQALVQQVLRRPASATDMPAWEGEPSVRAHIGDLYRYLDGRSKGEIGTGRPATE